MARGKAEFLVAMIGQDKLAGVLREAQSNLDEVGKKAKKAADSSGFDGFLGVIGDLNNGWTEMNAKIQLITGAVQAVHGAFVTTFEFLKKGEHLRNIDKIFHQISENGTKDMESLKEAVKGTIDDATLKSLSNRMRMLGISASDAAGLTEVAWKASQTGLENFEGLLQRLVDGIVSGSSDVMLMAGVTGDVRKAVEEYAISQKKSTEEIDAHTQRHVRAKLVIEDMEHLLRKTGARFTGLEHGAHEASASLKDFTDDMTKAIGATYKLKKATEQKHQIDVAQTRIGQLTTNALEDMRLKYRAIEDQMGLTSDEVNKLNERWGDLAPAVIAHEQAQRKATEATQLMVGPVEHLRAQLVQMGVETEEIDAITEEFGDHSVENFMEFHDAIIKVSDLVGVRFEQMKRDTEKAAGGFQQLASSTQDMLSKIAQAHDKGREEDKKRTSSSRSSRKEEQEILRNHVIWQESQLDELWGELAQHEKNVDDLKKKRFRMEATRNALLEQEQSRHEAEVSKVLQKELDAFERAESQKSSAADAHRAAQLAGLKEEQSLVMLKLELEKSRLDVTDDKGRAALDRKMSQVALVHQLQTEEISSEEFSIRRHLELQEFRNQEERRLLEERTRHREEALQSTIQMGTDAINISKQTEQNEVAVLGTLAAASGQVAKDWNALSSGSSAAINALGAVSSSAIRDQKAQAQVMGAFSAAQSIFEFARGNWAAGIGMAAASAAYFSISGDGSTGAKGGTGVAKGALTSGGGGAQLSGGQTQSAEMTINVMGFVGSTAQLGADVGKALDEVDSSGLPSGAVI